MSEELVRYVYSILHYYSMEKRALSRCFWGI